MSRADADAADDLSFFAWQAAAAAGLTSSEDSTICT
jgi:hypothetical protein